MQNKGIYLTILGVLFLVSLAATAYNIGVYSKTYQFTYATESQTNNPDGIVVFHLVNGSMIQFASAYTRERVSIPEMASGGNITIHYSFVNYPVEIDYSF